MKPILFSTEMVRAILDGRKTQTRRTIKPQPEKSTVKFEQSVSPVHWQSRLPVDLRALYPDSLPTTILGSIFKCPYGQVGDRLWVRETWKTGKGLDNLPPKLSGEKSPFQYKADMTTIRGKDVTKYSPWGKWRPSIFMPRWASRITLEITDIRVQRVQEITEEDAIAEGIAKQEYIDYKPNSQFGNDLKTVQTITFFAGLWDSINGKKYPWASNPWVWAISFKVVSNA